MDWCPRAHAPESAVAAVEVNVVDACLDPGLLEEECHDVCAAPLGGAHEGLESIIRGGGVGAGNEEELDDRKMALGARQAHCCARCSGVGSDIGSAQEQAALGFSLVQG